MDSAPRHEEKAFALALKLSRMGCRGRGHRRALHIPVIQRGLSSHLREAPSARCVVQSSPPARVVTSPTL